VKSGSDDLIQKALARQVVELDTKKEHEPGLQGRRTVGAMKQIRKEGALNRQSIICERDIRFNDQHFATMLIVDSE